jgi:hypothetical protein
MDRSGKTVIKPQFDEAGSFSEERAPVRVGNKVGYVDPTGTIVINPQFDFVEMRGCPPDLATYEFREGVARVNVAGRFGFIDTNGKYIHEPNLQGANPFSEGLAFVTSGGGESGYIDRSGKMVFNGKYSKYAPGGDFNNGLAPAAIDVEEIANRGAPSRRWGFLDSTGKWAITPQFEQAANFSDGLAPVGAGGKLGYIDVQGNFVINPQYAPHFWDFCFAASLSHFHEGFAQVLVGANEGKWKTIDKKGNVVFSDYEAVFGAGEGLVSTRTSEGVGYIDIPTGRMVIKPQPFDTAGPFVGGLARVTLGDQRAYIDRTGTYVGKPLDRSVQPRQPLSVSSSVTPGIGSKIVATSVNEFVGEWYAQSDCLKIFAANGDGLAVVKAWYCEAGEPATGVQAKLIDGELKGDDGVIRVTFREAPADWPSYRGARPTRVVVATYKRPPPNDGHINESDFHKVPDGTFR